MSIGPIRSRTLLELADLLLADAGFVREFVDTQPDAFPVLLAEDPEFVLAISEVHGVDQFAAADSAVAQLFRERIEQSSLGPKAWDTYIVLLSEAPSPDVDSTTVAISDLRYDTHSFRRIVRTSVVPSLSGLRDALRPFLPLSAASSVASLEDPLRQLERLLPSHGISEDDAARSVASFLNEVDSG